MRNKTLRVAEEGGRSEMMRQDEEAIPVARSTMTLQSRISPWTEKIFFMSSTEKKGESTHEDRSAKPPKIHK